MNSIDLDTRVWVIFTKHGAENWNKHSFHKVKPGQCETAALGYLFIVYGEDMVWRLTPPFEDGRIYFEDPTSFECVPSTPPPECMGIPGEPS